ncbi:MAG TPA: glucosamine-6-phosphate deaminase [Opitutales bacterium]|nr:glucosamine-6-phosphate deaminase [Opitutales bacterium]
MKPEIEQLEKTKTVIYPSAQEAVLVVAREMANLIRSRAKEKKNAVLGLATGSTPVGLYRELVRMHREEGLSFKNVVTFNLDEYYPISRENKQSYFQFMQDHLFKHVDIDPANINIPSGMVERKQVYQLCAEYEEKIRKAGGIDIQILGIGRTGHIGFNEPGSSRDSRTRMIALDEITRQDNARNFRGAENVPTYSITMGVATILEARKIYLMAWGAGKAEIVQEAVEGPVTDQVSASFLQEHPDAIFLLDEAAGAGLTRNKYPWLVSACNWTQSLTRRAVIWLSQHLDKPILKLVEDDYTENGMADLVSSQGPADKINVRVFTELQQTLTRWPAGTIDTSAKSDKKQPSDSAKRIVVFASEPQEEVASMGGTLHRLIDQGHEVHVVYQTSGNLGVAHDRARKYAEFLKEASDLNQNQAPENNLADQVLTFLADPQNTWSNSPEVRKIKTLVRRGEARAALRIYNLPTSNIHFLDLPFYEKGNPGNFHLADEDVEKITELLDEIEPHQIYIAGILADPHSVRRLCFEAMELALDRFSKKAWPSECTVWLYRAATNEWEIDQIDMACPLSPDELAIKTKATFEHDSQKSRLPLNCSSAGDPWKKAKDRSRKTAAIFDQLGLPEFEAIEAFRRWQP